MIEKLNRVPLREVWKNEAYDFTPWLQDNLEVLNEHLEFSLSSAEREQAAGTFSVDLVAEDEGGHTVVIENQLERSDHDHLGKLVTYLTAYEAKAAIWIVSDPRPEHVRAVSWLNEATGASFYLLKVEAVQIGASAPAAMFTVIVKPSEESRKLGDQKKEIAGRSAARQQFWGRLLDHAKPRTPLHANISPSQYGYIGASVGIRGLLWIYVANKDETTVELYIDLGKGCERENEEVFDHLVAQRATIEETYGGELSWLRLDGRRACRIRGYVGLGGFKDEERADEICEATVGAMIRLEAGLRPHLKSLP